MRKIILLLIVLFVSFCLFAEQKTITVPTFYSYEEEWNSRMPIISDIVRSELVRKAYFRVLDYSLTDAMVESYSSEKDEANGTLKLLKALGTDYVLIGTVSPVKENVEYHTETITVQTEVDRGALGEIGKFLLGERAVKTKTEQQNVTVATQESTITIVMSIIDSTDGFTVASARSTIYKWEDFSSIVGSLIDSLLASFEKNIRQSIPFTLEGVWCGELYSSPYDDIYHFEFKKNGTVEVVVESYGTNGTVTKSSGSGRYKYDAAEQVVTITINRLSNAVQHLQNVRWSAKLIIRDSENFTIIIPATSSSGSKLVGVDFFLERTN